MIMPKSSMPRSRQDVACARVYLTITETTALPTKGLETAFHRVFERARRKGHSGRLHRSASLQPNSPRMQPLIKPPTFAMAGGLRVGEPPEA